ncbi:unnamed protein product [Paramecium primaurelia]|uniref:Uncharacterized protein n=1 Tax=Paramecium primaurelia TaxID=5886 RepID=A0A8S1PRL8_PARPR|nr:unnamed protein product [Paramecium primaurelia]
MLKNKKIQNKKLFKNKGGQNMRPDIPECHQKYYYNVLLEHQHQTDKLIKIEIDSITNNKSVVKTLHQLIIGRERCLKEISRAKDEQQLYDHLIKHKMDKKYIDNMIDLQEYFNKQINDYRSLNFHKQSYENSNIDYAGSPGFLCKNPINLSIYASKVIYTAEDLQFNLVSYSYKDLEAILENWSTNNVQELNESFKYPITHIKDLLMYWQEAAIVRINENGLIICSIDQDYQGRRWILHQIYLHKDPQWKQKFTIIIQHFIKMLIKQGDNFRSLAICCSNDQSIKKVLIDLKFIFSKNIDYNKFNVVIYEQKFKIRYYFTPVTLKMFRIYATQTQSTLITNEELLIAKYCANIGKNTIIQFENNILALSPYLKKLYGLQYMLIQKPNDIKNKYQIEFSTPIQTPVYFQQFNVKLHFKYFSSEFYRNNTQPYLRIIAHPTMNEFEPSILQLSSLEISNSMIYLISTIDPFIKMYQITVKQQIPQEVQHNQISKSNIQSFINQIFEKFDKKQECQHHVWLPQFKCCGKQLKLSDTNIQGYFQNDTYLSVMYPRNPSLHTNQYFNDNDKIIQPPFLFGIIQSDLEKINKPLFSILIDKEHIIKYLINQLIIYLTLLHFNYNLKNLSLYFRFVEKCCLRDQEIILSDFAVFFIQIQIFPPKFFIQSQHWSCTCLC